MRQLAKTILRVAVGALVALMVPVIASRVVDGWNWRAGTFVIVYVLFFGTGMAYALIAGFILNRLPIGRILSAIVRLVFIAFKPAILAYGATKLYQAAQGENE